MTFTPREVVLLANLDNIPIPCDHKTCAVVSEVWAVCRTCHHPTALCNTHRPDQLDPLQLTETTPGHWVLAAVDIECDNCHTYVAAGAWATLFTLQAIA